MFRATVVVLGSQRHRHLPIIRQKQGEPRDVDGIWTLEISEGSIFLFPCYAVGWLEGFEGLMFLKKTGRVIVIVYATATLLSL